MFDNIGEKIKKLASVLFVVGTISTVLLGCILMSDEFDILPIAVLILVLGPILSWVSSCLLYGFGELIVKTTEIERNTRYNEKETAIQSQITIVKDQIIPKTVDEKRHNAESTADKNKKTCSNDCWICDKCQAVNLNKRVDCWRCSQPK